MLTMLLRDHLIAAHPFSPPDKLDKLIDMSFSECSVEGKLSKFKVSTRLEGTPGFCDPAIVRMVLSAYIVDSKGGQCLRL